MQTKKMALTACMDDIKLAFLDAMRAAGIPLPSDIVASGKLQRAHCEDHKSHTKNLAYVLHTDRKPSGWALDFTTGASARWSASGKAEPLSRSERDQIKKAQQDRQAEIVAMQNAAALNAGYAWESGKPAPSDYPYLVNKQIQPHGARLIEKMLALPLYDANLKLRGLQYIDYVGEKRFMPSCQKSHCFWWLGASTQTILIGEGFATAASLHEATGLQTFIGWDSGNLGNIAQIVRQKNRSAKIVICGDFDKSGTGQHAAKAAANAIGAKFILPPSVGTDFNDYLNDGGVLCLN